MVHKREFSFIQLAPLTLVYQLMQQSLFAEFLYSYDVVRFTMPIGTKMNDHIAFPVWFLRTHFF